MNFDDQARDWLTDNFESEPEEDGCDDEMEDWNKSLSAMLAEVAREAERSERWRCAEIARTAIERAQDPEDDPILGGSRRDVLDGWRAAAKHLENKICAADAVVASATRPTVDKPAAPAANPVKAYSNDCALVGCNISVPHDHGYYDGPAKANPAKGTPLNPQEKLVSSLPPSGPMASERCYLHNAANRATCNVCKACEPAPASPPPQISDEEIENRLRAQTEAICSERGTYPLIRATPDVAAALAAWRERMAGDQVAVDNALAKIQAMLSGDYYPMAAEDVRVARDLLSALTKETT